MKLSDTCIVRVPEFSQS